MNDRSRDVIIGGLLGVIAVCAILFKLMIASYSLEATAEAIIDFAGIGVSILLFYTVIHEKIPSPFFKRNMKRKMDDWKKDNTGLITASEEVSNFEEIEEDKGSVAKSKSFVRYYMICELGKFMEDGANEKVRKGEFVKLPIFESKNYKEGVTLKIYLNQSTFQSRLKAKGNFEDKKEVYDYLDRIAPKIVLKVTNRFPGLIESHSISSVGSSPKYEICLKLKGNFTLNSNIDILIDVINYIMLLYSYAA